MPERISTNALVEHILNGEVSIAKYLAEDQRKDCASRLKEIMPPFITRIEDVQAREDEIVAVVKEVVGIGFMESLIFGVTENFILEKIYEMIENVIARVNSRASRR